MLVIYHWYIRESSIFFPSKYSLPSILCPSFYIDIPQMESWFSSGICWNQSISLQFWWILCPQSTFWSLRKNQLPGQCAWSSVSEDFQPALQVVLYLGNYQQKIGTIRYFNREAADISTKISVSSWLAVCSFNFPWRFPLVN